MTLKFIDDIWNNFDYQVAMQSLLSSEEQFWGSKSILLAALSAWIIAPTDQCFRQVAASSRILDLCIKIEESGYQRSRDGNADALTFTEAWARIGRPEVSAFYEQVYHPIGGLRVVSRERAQSDLPELFREKSRSLPKIAQIIRVYHHCIAYLADANCYYPPSLLKTSELVEYLLTRKSLLRGSDPGRHTRKLFKDCRLTANFIYAASTIQTLTGSSLLDDLCKAPLRWEDHGQLIVDLLQRARFLEEAVIPKIYANDGVGISLSGLNIDSQPFKAPMFDGWQAAEIRRKFHRRGSSMGRATEPP